MSDKRSTIKRFVVKVGASVLTDADGRPEPAQLKQLASQIAACVRPACRQAGEDRQVVLVSSGAIACGMAALRLKRRPTALAHLQACAAIGQGQLVGLYTQAFAEHRLTVAQVLLTQADLADRSRRRNAQHTLEALLSQGVVPIINENDTVSVEEITFGDNDRLAAVVASLLEVDLLVLLSDVDGLLRDGRVIARLETLDRSHEALVFGSSRQTTTGGMGSKLAAARIARHAGIPLIIANGHREHVLREILQGRPVGTLIAPPTRRLASHKWWLAFSARQPAGSVVIDDGAVEALVHRGKSLLASGVREVRGRFHAGDAIAIVDAARYEVARGRSNFSSSDLARIRGLNGDEIARFLGPRSTMEVVHRSHLVLTREL